MNVKYFADTDTLYIELYPAEVDETRDLDEDTLLELDAALLNQGRAVAPPVLWIPAFAGMTGEMRA